MSIWIRCAPLAAALAAAAPALATGIEKPPSVPPEVEEARQACPTVVGPCYGYHPTRWRALPCCTPVALPPAALPPGTLPSAAPSTPIPAAGYGRQTSGAARPTVVIDRGPTPRDLPAPEVRPIRAWVNDKGK